ncbi:hypothetical protein D081_1173 [Anaerovibrio sp. JC8]|nr:hypothetical protein D081_1173 [Anaerovibrio sp. JC8]
MGESVYDMEESTGATNAPISIYCYRAASWTAGRPIVFVFHGMNRNADDYRAGWESLAEKDGLFIVCPEFTEEKYPGSRYYNTGNIMDKTNGKGHLQPKDKWVFPVIDKIIRDVKARMGAENSSVAVFGHSAGAQMVHRYALFGGATEADLIMPANAGWYTMPNANVRFPYGLGGVPMSESDLAMAFAKPMVILLGDADTKRNENLRQTPEADAQGFTRFERGQHFFYQGSSEAARIGATFNWQLVTVPGVGHNGDAMAKAAAQIIEQVLLK